MSIQRSGDNQYDQSINQRKDADLSHQGGKDLTKLLAINEAENLEAWARFPSISMGDPQQASRLYQLMLDTYGPPPATEALQEFLKDNPAIRKLKTTHFEARTEQRTPEPPSGATKRKALALNEAFSSIFEAWPQQATPKSMRKRAVVQQEGSPTLKSAELLQPAKKRRKG